MVSVVAGACTPAIATRGQVEDLLLDFARGRVSGTPPERGAADYVHVQNITAGGVERTAIFVHPPAIVSFDVRLLPGARFEALAGIDDRAIEKGSDGATFHVRAIRQGKVEKSVSLDLDPGTAGGRGWRPVGVDLADLGGRHATIELSTEAGKSSSYDWVGFAAPRIVSRGEPVRARRPEDGSIVLVSLDTVRVDRLGAYGEPLPLTPRIDALTRKLAIFPDAVSPSHWTLPAHMSLFASLPADVHGADVHRGIPEGLPLLTTELRRAGYATAGFAADVGWLRPEYGFGRGFDLYLPTSEDARVRSERAREHLERLDGRRCFLFVHFFDAHSDFGSIPYEASAESMRAFAPGAPTFPPCAGERCASKVLWDMNAAGQRYAAGDEATMRAMYGAGLHDLDHEVGRLRAELRETGSSTKRLSRSSPTMARRSAITEVPRSGLCGDHPRPPRSRRPGRGAGFAAGWRASWTSRRRSLPARACACRRRRWASISTRSCHPGVHRDGVRRDAAPDRSHDDAPHEGRSAGRLRSRGGSGRDLAACGGAGGFARVEARGAAKGALRDRARPRCEAERRARRRGAAAQPRLRLQRPGASRRGHAALRLSR
ncbi:MAG: sulfatase-like hydrolase/transferase [Acidobacteriota bacterium]